MGVHRFREKKQHLKGAELTWGIFFWRVLEKVPGLSKVSDLLEKKLDASSHLLNRSPKSTRCCVFVAFSTHVLTPLKCTPLNEDFHNTYSIEKEVRVHIPSMTNHPASLRKVLVFPASKTIEALIYCSKKYNL